MSVCQLALVLYEACRNIGPTHSRALDGHLGQPSHLHLKLAWNVAMSKGRKMAGDVRQLLVAAYDTWEWLQVLKVTAGHVAVVILK